MWIRQLQIENFRGIKNALVEFSERQTVLVGSNGAGKSTILESLALIFGRDRLVRTLTEHDFYGSDPAAGDRIRLVATITGFSSNLASAHGQWFSERRGIPKWRQKSTGKLLAEPQLVDDELTVQVGLCARFDRGELNVETIRYFHDDDAIVDPFDEEVVQIVPPRLLGEIGFFLVPAHRTWDKLVSFNSELFRRILDSSGSLEATEILAERDRLRLDEYRVDLQGSLKALCEGINSELKHLLSGDPTLELRLTGTDSESLLYALIPHYRYGASVSLPAGRHGSGLLSLQTALLVLQVAARRRKANQNVIIAVEEPELHMPPGVHAQVLHRLRNASNQLVCTTHSPRVAAVCSALDIRVVNSANTVQSPVAPLLKSPLPGSSKNGMRKLFQESRQAFIEALMHRFVLVPEGRMDAEWFKLLSLIAVTDQELGSCAEPVPFGTVFGIVPTHDACVVETIERIGDIRSGTVALVDGDSAGDSYVKSLLKAKCPPKHIIQWPQGWEIEDVVGWILGSEESLVPLIQAEMPNAPASLAGIVAWIKLKPSEKGAKTDILAYEAIMSALLTSSSAKSKTRKLLEALVGLTNENQASALLLADQALTTVATSVWRIVLEP
jgi:putative ATP-dependent endonuclease of the OLD family